MQLDLYLNAISYYYDFVAMDNRIWEKLTAQASKIALGQTTFIYSNGNERIKCLINY